MKKENLIKIAKYIVILLIFLFIFRYLYLNFNSLRYSDLNFNLSFLLLSVLIYLVHLLCNAIIWHVITFQNGCSINIFSAIKLRVYAEFGKYIPGKVFTYGILLFSYEKSNIAKKKIAACSVQELILSMLSAIIISLLSIFVSEIKELEHYKFIFLIIAACCLLFVYPPLLQFIMNIFFRIFKKEKITLAVSFGKVIVTLFLYLINWLVFGWAFYFFINSFYPLPVNYYFFSTGAFAIAGIIGFISVFAPAGLGVREGVLIFTLSFILTAAVSSLISLISRIWITICEILLFSIIFLLDLILNKKNKT
jgi:glycosyltransferase 2 family protein